jgi:5-oxoprolinase (ATP-hydrolysing) subunit A
MRIDLNADIGETLGNGDLGDEIAMMKHLTSVSIACGFHAGDALTIRRFVAAAVEHGVAIGAHVSYEEPLEDVAWISPEQLEAEILYQVSALDGIARVAGTKVSYIKPHGPLYDRVIADPVQAAAFVKAAVAWHEPLAVLTVAGGELARCVTSWGLQVVAEGFADRHYEASGVLVPLAASHSPAFDAEAVTAQAQRLVAGGGIQSLCVQSTPVVSPDVVAAVRARLELDGAEVAAFT